LIKTAKAFTMLLKISIVNAIISIHWGV